MSWLSILFTNRKPQTRVSPGTYRNAVPIEEATGDDGFVRIVPVGDFPHHHDGAHAVTAQHVTEMEANFRRFSTDVLVDRDHESLWGTTRAAGWITDLEARDDGLYARVPEWTETVSSEIERREWRYFSPVYTLQYFDKQGQNIGAVLDSVALTNRPYFREGEIDAIGNAAPTPDTTTVFMEREDLIEALGLP